MRTTSAGGGATAASGETATRATSSSTSAPDRRRDDQGAATGVGATPPTEVWGVLNVTPDSFSDGGRFFAAPAALSRGLALAQEGADVVDVGGESSRPAGAAYGAGAATVSPEEEIARVVPVIGALVERGARVSIDTVKAAVARAALDAGATFVNDVSCGASEELLGVVASRGASLVLMHNRGRGELTPDNTRYGDVVADVARELEEAVERATRAGVARSALWLDPGIGFAKTAQQSAELLARLGEITALGLPVLVGPSRKSFIAELAPGPTGDRPGPLERVGGTAAAVTAAVLAGARAVRVHDVASMRQAARVADALHRLVRARES